MSEHSPEETAPGDGTTRKETSTREAPLEPKLVFTNGPIRGRVATISRDRAWVGRHGDNDVVVDIGRTVSSRHAVIYRDPEDGSWWIEDAGSKNGTYVNDERIVRTRLREGDIVALARNGPEILFTFSEPRLPGLFETTMTTYRRTRSLGRAVRELLPSRRSRPAAGISSVERILDDRLERLARRTRWYFVASVLGTLALVAATAVAVVVELVKPSALKPRIALDITPEIEPIYAGVAFPLREVPAGHVTVSNRAGRPLTGLVLSFEFVKDAADYLVEPFVTPVPDLEPDESHRIALLPRFSEKIRSPRTHEVTAVFRVLRDDEVVKERVHAVYIHGTNVFNWEEPGRITSFIDPQDRAVRVFVRDVLRVQPPAAHRDFPPKRFRDAVGLVTALAQLRPRYVPDAVRPTSEKIDPRANDQVKFPWETLDDRAGDCDDLSVLSAALFEAAGIPAAIAIGPRHVLAMFDSGVSEALLDTTPLDPATVVVWNERVWIPIETTRLGDLGAGFTTAWSAAWPRREEILAGEMEIIEVRESWKRFAPAPAKADADEEALRGLGVDEDALLRDVEKTLEELRHLFRKNLQRRVKEIEESDATGPERDRRIGLLHARSGLFDEARDIFVASILGESLPPEQLAARLPDAPDTAAAAWLLLDLGACLTLGARRPADLELAALAYREGLERLEEPADSPLRAEYILRLALVHRLRGDLAAERTATETAFATTPTLRETYDEMVRGTGRRAGVGGSEERDFLLRGMR